MKKHLVVIITGAIAGLMLYAYFAYNDDLQQAGNQKIQLVVSGISGVVLAYFIWKLNELLDRYIPWKTNIGFRMLIGVAVISLVAFSFIWTGINAYSFLTANEIIGFGSYFSPLVKLAILTLIATIIYQVVYFALHSFYVFTMLHVEEIKAERKQVEYQLQALKSQLSPHFLFNNLNSISSLAYLDKLKAETFIRKMAVLYSNVLNNYGKELITVDQEINNVNSYGYLMHSRFGGSLSLETNISDSVRNTLIPPLSLQLLIENAIKHNEISEEKPLQITLVNDENFIIISNNKTAPRKNVVSHKVGLKNISNRYRLIANRDIKIINEENFVVKLPILH